jgi:hypothetical protein
LVRKIQDWRKEQKLQMSDRPEYILVATDAEREVAIKNKAQLEKLTNLSKLTIQ